MSISEKCFFEVFTPFPVSPRGEMKANSFPRQLAGKVGKGVITLK
jgi:hypothetical protein